MDTFPQSLDSLTDKQSKLESTMLKLIEKVDALDSKMEKIMSLLLSGHSDDAKRGRSQHSQTMMIMLILGVVVEIKKNQPLMLLRICRSS